MTSEKVGRTAGDGAAELCGAVALVYGLGIQLGEAQGMAGGERRAAQKQQPGCEDAEGVHKKVVWV